jgi:uncharacterized membrane protein
MLDKNFKLIVLVIGLLGLVDGIYLTILKLTNNESMCIKGIGDCLSVNSSVYSQILGIPIALIGSLGYLAFILVVLLENRSEFFKTYSIYFMFGITLIGVLYSAYLTYLELAVIRAICPFCVISAMIMLILFILTVTRLVNPQAETT